MLSLEEVLREQEDLTTLCQDRELKSKEIFLGNSLYGTDKIIKRYAGLSENYKLRTIIPHGICLSRDYLWKAEKEIPLPVMYVCPGFRKNICLKETNKLCVPIASPFLYLKKILDKDKSVDPVRNGTIFFPSHSTHRVTAVANYKAMAEKLNTLDKIYHPITVCIYWKDYLLGHHKEFEKKGFDIVSCGHIYDPNFLYRFYHLTRSHKYASSNEVGSHLFYSTSLECTFFLLKGWMSKHEVTTKGGEHDIGGANLIVANLYKEFDDVVTINTKKQLSLVHEYMCADNLLSPNELYKQIKSAEKLDGLGFAFNVYGKTACIALPFLYFRVIQKMYIYMRKLIVNFLKK